MPPRLVSGTQAKRNNRGVLVWGGGEAVWQIQETLAVRVSDPSLTLRVSYSMGRKSPW